MSSTSLWFFVLMIRQPPRSSRTAPCFPTTPFFLSDIVDAISDVPEIAAAVIALLVPVPGQFQLRVLVAGRCKVDQREAALFIVVPTNLPQPQQIVESEAFLDIGHTDHRVEIFHLASLLRTGHTPMWEIGRAHV